MRIDFLIGQNPYSTTAYFAKCLSQALMRAKCQVRLFDIADGNFYKAFYAIMSDPPDLTCSFSDVTLGEKETLGDAWGIFHLTFSIDHAIYFLHQTQGSFSLLSTIDEEDLAFLQSGGFERGFFLPHGVDSSLTAGNEKLFDVVMLASCIDFEKIRSSWKRKYRDAKILEEASRRVLHEEVSCLRALLDLGVSDELPLYHQEVENYVRGYERVKLVQALDTPRLHVWGQGGWRKYLKDATIHRPIAFESALKVMGQSKVVLNSAPTLLHGSHERIFHSLLLGSLPLTSDTPWVRKNFCNGVHLTTYKLKNVREQLEHLLSNDHHRQEMVENGKREVLEKHTWDERATRLIDFFKRIMLKG